MEAAMSPELRAKIDAIEAKYGAPKEHRKAVERQQARPRVVVEAGKVVAEAEVEVSPRDPNWREGPRPGFVTIDLERVEREWRAARAEEEWDRARRAELDPYNLGLWRRGR
jgi:hypothetical protein